jgi:hypothetical protein
MAKLPSIVVQFRQHSTPVPEVSVAVAKRSAPQPVVTGPPGVDLSGKPKVIFLIGRGGSGKTVLGRYLLERAQEAKRPTIAAALDPVNRTLANYVSDVAQPETSDPADSARFLRELLGFAMQEKQSVVVDLGGGDTTLATVLDEMPDLAAVMESAGVAAVALYLLTPRIDDIAPFLSLGFQPAATAFVCNRVTPGDFGPLLEQRAIREALTAGAREVHMPRLDADATAFIEQRRLSFAQAAKGEKAIGPWRAAQVRNWLRAMDAAFAGIGTWLA